MHFHLTWAQFVIAAFALTLGILFALATAVQLRLQRARPFRISRGRENDPGRIPSESSSQDDDTLADEQSVFTDFGVRYSNSHSRRAIALNRDWRERG
jgi:hypothetical protein